MSLIAGRIDQNLEEHGGIQTLADGYTKRDQNLRQIGPGFLMSMWGERSPDAIRQSAGGFWQSSGHEGDFVSVRRPYEWQKGKYAYRVVRMDREVVDGKPCTWVGAFVYSHENDENIFVGSLEANPVEKPTAATGKPAEPFALPCCSATIKASRQFVTSREMM